MSLHGGLGAITPPTPLSLPLLMLCLSATAQLRNLAPQAFAGRKQLASLETSTRSEFVEIVRWLGFRANIDRLGG